MTSPIPRFLPSWLSLALLLTACFLCLPLTPLFSEPASDTPSIVECQYLAIFEKKGDFLELLPQHPREVLRRLGKKAEKVLPLFPASTFETAGFTPLDVRPKNPLGEPIRSTEWNAQQRKQTDELRILAGPLWAQLEKEIPVPAKGLYLRFIANPKSWIEPIMKLAQDPELSQNLKPNQLYNLKTKLLPLLETADFIGVSGSLSDAGIDLIIRFIGSKAYTASVTEAYTADKTLSCARYLDTNCLLSFGQVHVIPSPQIIIENLKAIPQLSIVENFLQNAGLDLEKDILPAQAVDSLVMVNLEPTGDGGMVDFRAIARFADPMKILAILPGLKKLCTDIGIYAAPQTEEPVGVKLSYFLVPTFGLHLALIEGHALLATSRANLTKLHQQMQSVNTGKTPAFVVPEGSHRYWRIRFQNLNEQIQKFLQSPLLAGKGFPPIPNLSMLEELSDFTMISRVKPEYLEIRLSLPLPLAAEKGK